MNGWRRRARRRLALVVAWLSSHVPRSLARRFEPPHGRRRALVVLALTLAAIGYWRSLPDPLFADPLSTIVLARDGELLGARIADDGQWRFPPIGEVPDKFATAIVAYEDRRFHRHPGVDPLALARAVKLNLAQGRIVSGGSTLSMQVVRLARGRAGRSYASKLVEMLLALRLELGYRKAEILALYASHAPFGGNVVGLEAAAWRYFGRSPERLSWAEACTLAVLPNSPALIHLGRHRELLQAKRDRLLRRLHQDGRLGALDLELALREPLPAEPLPLPQHAPHLLATLRAEVPDRHRIATTLDATLQRAATGATRARVGELARQGVHNAAALVIDNRSFEVLAYVGNADWSVDSERAYAVDIVRRPRSTGSILKPLLYATMLDAGEILPQTLVPDVPTQFSGYMPENFDRSYRGAVPAEVALAQSLNVPAVRMLRQHGVNRFYDFLRHLGMTTLVRRPEEYGLTLILGGAEGTLWEVVGLYANLAYLARQEGPGAAPNYRQLRLTLADRDESARRSEIGPGAAWLTLNALLEVARPAEEGYWKNFASSRKIAWKTGTSWGMRDAWAVGNTTHYTVGVWTGNASGEGRPGLTGATAAAPLLFDLFNHLEPGTWFAPPAAHLRQVEVCRNDGYLANGDCPSERQWVPRDSHFAQVSPHNLVVHLDPGGRFRVHGGCERVARMRHVGWFVLPPGQEHYYRRHHADYRPLPPYRADCERQGTTRVGRGLMDFLYPNLGTRLYIPMDLAEKKGRVVFEAVHRDPGVTLYWHLDEQYVGATRTFHQRALDIAAGAHQITIVDPQGNRLSRAFEVLGRETRQ
jgi:penicillin-binding protein 1C